MNFSLQTPPTTAPPAPSPTRDLPGLERPPSRRAGRGGVRSKKALAVLGVVVLGAAGVVAASVPSVGKTLGGLFAGRRTDVIPYTVQRGKLVVTVKERGNLESANNKDVANEVEGSTTIIKILPEGTHVKAGDVVCELDSASLRDQLTNQEIVTKRAGADFENAKKTREVAEIAVKEYIEGTYKQAAKEIEGELTLAHADKARSKDRLEYSEKMVELGYMPRSQLLADQQSLMKAEISEQQAVEKGRVLKDYTKEKEETSLRAEVEKAKADELAKLAAFDLEQKKEAKLRRQIDHCILKAPIDGLIVYANDNNMFRGNNQPQIEEGAQVRERQKIFSLPDITHMQVNTKVHESMVNLVQPGLKARIRVESNNKDLQGTTKSVAPLPDAGSWMSSDVKMYTTLVTIDTPGQANLRPGMSAEVEILITQVSDVLSIPVQSVLQAAGKDFVMLLTPDGPRRIEVKLGITNDKLIEVKEGLKVGDQVAMNPNSLLTEEEKRELFSPNAKKDWGNVPPGTPTVQVAPGLKGADAKGKAGPGAAKKKRGGGMEAMKAIFSKMRSLPEEERSKLRDPGLSEEERSALMKKAGITEAEQEQLKQMRESFGAGGPGGGGGFGGGGGGFGGGGRGPGGGGPSQ